MSDTNSPLSLARALAPEALDAAARTVGVALLRMADRMAQHIDRIGAASERAAASLCGPWWADVPVALLPTVPTPDGPAIPVGLAVVAGTPVPPPALPDTPAPETAAAPAGWTSVETSTEETPPAAPAPAPRKRAKPTTVR